MNSGRDLKVGDVVKFKSGLGPVHVTGLPTIQEIHGGGYVTLLWTHADGKQWNSACHMQNLELVSDGSEPRQ